MEFDEHDDPEDDLPTPSFPSPLPPHPLQQPNSGNPPSDPLSSTPRRAAASSGGRYRECLKNHAVGIGGHAVDGCGEFMPAGEEGTLDALKCAACSCHRNFHRKEPDGAPPSVGLNLLNLGDAVGATSFHHQFSPSYYRSPVGVGYLHHPHFPPGHRPPPHLALPSTSGADDDDLSSDPYLGGSSRKRFRTKFSQEQKERMLSLAERLGWRIQKHDEALVQQFCAEVGVKRHVLKVWMHNNKHTLGKKP